MAKTKAVVADVSAPHVYEGNILAVGLRPTHVLGRFEVVRYVIRNGVVVDEEVVRDPCDLKFARGRMEDEASQIIEDAFGPGR